MIGGNPRQMFEANSAREIGDIVAALDALRLNPKARLDVAEA
jgi:hypothetical protein